MTANENGGIGEISLEPLGVADSDELERLAQRDSRAVPTGSLLGARLDGRLVAALSIGSGDWVADPFVRTQELLELLAGRAAELGANSALRRRSGLPGRPLAQAP
jgi:hypothetical protein